MRTTTPHRVALSESGAALVELVVALPVMVALVVGTADFARVFYTAMELTNAARAGAQYGARNLGASTSTTAMQTAATNSVNISGVTAGASRLCQCATAAAVFSNTSPSANNCIDASAVSCPTAGTFRVITITVTATKTFTTISPYPGIPHTLPLARAAIMRVTE